MDHNKFYQEKAHRYIPGGAHTYSRGDDQYPINAPSILERGQGAYVWDASGNRFLDYGMALRAITVGYNEERISNAAIEEIKKGNNLTRASVTEVKAAEVMCSLFPYAESVKFAKNGSTVTSAAIKLSRAFTGRKYIARCAQHAFFSYDDWFIGDTVVNSGVPQETSSLTLRFNYNDFSSLDHLFKTYPNQIAAVILEPATTEEPAIAPGTQENFLQQVERICRQNDTVFILDEMITGFRWRLKGAAEYYGVTPDLATFGKGMANGFSVAALAGRRDIMMLGGIDHEKERVFLISTTHGAEMCGLGAFLETMKVYQEEDVVRHMWTYGQDLMNGVQSIASEAGISEYLGMTGVPCSPAFVTRDRTGTASLPFRTLFLQEMIHRNILVPWVSFCLRHGQNELEQTLEAVRGTAQVYAKALEDGIEHHLKGRPVKPVFRKFN